MPLSITPLSEIMAAEATGVDLRQPLADKTVKTLKAALAKHAVLCIRDQTLDPGEYVAAARLFGAPVRQVNRHTQFREHPEIGILSSDATDVHGTGERVVNGATWHTDHSFTERPPMGTILYALVIPETGGETSFCDMRAAYAALGADMKQRIDGLRAVHAYQSRRSPRKMLTRTDAEKAETADVTHPLVRVHPPTGARALYMSTTRLDRIADIDLADGDALVDELFAHATQDKFVYHHEWRVGDMLIWDNRCTMHHANGNYPHDQKRLMQRIMIEGEAPV
ncbi:MAG: taurine dioxygenase [Alphaproteobacteria bacterium]|jgi:taurine dioxygenase